MAKLSGTFAIPTSVASAATIRTVADFVPGPSWTRRGLIGQGPRQEYAVASIDEDIYLLGGVHLNDLGAFETINRVEVYNVAKESWTEAASLLQPLNHPNVASVDGKLFLLGGLAGQSNWTAVADAYVYTPSNDTWLSVATLPNDTCRGSSAVGVYKNKIYLAGGMTLLEGQGGVQDSLASVIVYDTIEDTWDPSLPDLPRPRQHVGGAVVDSIFYVIASSWHGGDYGQQTGLDTGRRAGFWTVGIAACCHYRLVQTQRGLILA